MLTPIFTATALSASEQLDLAQFRDQPHTFDALNPRATETQVWARPDGALVFKVFDIRRVKQRWRARWKRPCPLHGNRYGWAERTNAERFSALGLPGLAVRAYLEKRNTLQCSQQVVAYPYLQGYRTLHACLAEQPLAALDALEPVILQMAQVGVFHLDLNTRNVMLSDQGDVRIIDYEYMAWNQQRQGELYAYCLGYLWQKWAGEFVDENAFDQWANLHLERRQPLFDVCGQDCRGRYALGKHVELSRVDRYGLFS